MNLLKGLELNGRILFNEPLCRHTTFRIGGPVDNWFQPKDFADLKVVLEACHAQGVRVLVIGEGSNLLVGDGPLRMTAIHLGGSFQAGMGLQRFIFAKVEDGLSGLEFMAGVPGTVGGAIKMNAGAGLKGPWISDFIKRVKICDYSGRVRWIEKRDLEFGYRRSGLNEAIILEAEFELEKAKNKTVIREEYHRFLKEKKEKQELTRPSAGCIFKNPKGSESNAAQLIEGSGLKGKQIGGAMVSAKHANFIINTGNATFNNVMELIDLIKTAVFNKYKIMLETEIEILRETAA